MYSEEELVALLQLLLAAPACNVHGRDALHVCVMCHAVGCLECYEAPCACCIEPEDDFWLH